MLRAAHAKKSRVRSFRQLIVVYREPISHRPHRCRCPTRQHRQNGIACASLPSSARDGSPRCAAGTEPSGLEPRKKRSLLGLHRPIVGLHVRLLQLRYRRDVGSAAKRDQVAVFVGDAGTRTLLCRKEGDCAAGADSSRVSMLFEHGLTACGPLRLLVALMVLAGFVRRILAGGLVFLLVVFGMIAVGHLLPSRHLIVSRHVLVPRHVFVLCKRGALQHSKDSGDYDCEFLHGAVTPCDDDGRGDQRDDCRRRAGAA